MNTNNKIRLFTIPNGITLLNLLCGIIAIFISFKGYFHFAALLVILGAIFDFLDGFAARLLKSYSEIGKELDSLADLITFGLAPAFIIFNILEIITIDYKELNYIAFLIPLFSALRLAKFNVDTRQSDSFIGLPTPANALFFISFALIYSYSKITFLNEYFLNKYLIYSLIVIFSFFLISEIPMFSLKFKTWNFTDNKIRYIFIVISLILLIILQYYSIIIIIVLYIILSIINKLKFKTLNK